MFLTYIDWRTMRLSVWLFSINSSISLYTLNEVSSFTVLSSSVADAASRLGEQRKLVFSPCELETDWIWWFADAERLNCSCRKWRRPRKCTIRKQNTSLKIGIANRHFNYNTYTHVGILCLPTIHRTDWISLSGLSIELQKCFIIISFN